MCLVCTVSDGWDAQDQAVNITIAPLPTQVLPTITSVPTSTNSTILLQLSGASGFTYVLETVTNLGMSDGWLPTATNTLGANGVWLFDDTITNTPQRFYRLRLAP